LSDVHALDVTGRQPECVEGAWRDLLEGPGGAAGWMDDSTLARMDPRSNDAERTRREIAEG
jgi:hypothetical protein